MNTKINFNTKSRIDICLIDRDYKRRKYSTIAELYVLSLSCHLTSNSKKIKYKK